VMSKLVRTTRWTLVTGLVGGLLFSGLSPLMTASSCGARAAEETPSKKSCCSTATAGVRCGMGCCSAPSPRPSKPALPASPNDDRRSGNPCLLAAVAVDAATHDDKITPDWSHGPSALTGVSLTLQSTHVRLNA